MKMAVGMTNTAKHSCHIVAPPGGNHSTATGAAENFCGRCWQGQSVPTTGLHGELGLDNWVVLEYTR